MLQRLNRGKKLLLGLLLIYLVLKWRSTGQSVRVLPASHRQPPPLLEQPVNKQFNSERVWVSVGICYRSRWDLVQASLAASLWRSLAGVNVVLQVFSDSPLPGADSVLLTSLEETGVQVLRHTVLTERVGEENPCDCALQAELAGALLSRNIGLREDDIVMTASHYSFLAKPHILNVFQSNHSAWMFITEAVFYGGQPWPTSFTALTTANWRRVTGNTSSCSQLVQQDPYLGERYKPTWREAVQVKRKSVLAAEVAQLVSMVGQEAADGSEELELVRKGSQVMGMFAKWQIPVEHVQDLFNVSRDPISSHSCQTAGLLGLLTQTHLASSSSLSRYLTSLATALGQVSAQLGLANSSLSFPVQSPQTALEMSEVLAKAGVPAIAGRLDHDVVADRSKVDRGGARSAVEHLVTRMVLLKQMCTAPSWNHIWGRTGAGAGYSANTFDREICWKGMGLASCQNHLGYWHYPGMPGCNWWSFKIPREVLEDSLGAGHPVRLLVEKEHPGLVFSSS